MTRRPYIPAGCDQQGRVESGRYVGGLRVVRDDPDEILAAQAEGARMCGGWPYVGTPSIPGPLTEAELDRHIAEMHPSPAPRIPRVHVPPELIVFRPIRKPGRIRLALRRAWRWLMAPRCAL